MCVLCVCVCVCVCVRARLCHDSILDTQDIGISIAILAGTVFIVWAALIVSRWRLTKMLGYALLVCYALFVGYTLLKPSEC